MIGGRLPCRARDPGRCRPGTDDRNVVALAQGGQLELAGGACGPLGCGALADGGPHCAQEARAAPALDRGLLTHVAVEHLAERVARPDRESGCVEQVHPEPRVIAVEQVDAVLEPVAAWKLGRSWSPDEQYRCHLRITGRRRGVQEQAHLPGGPPGGVEVAPVLLHRVGAVTLSLIHISAPTRRTPISYAVFC